jgi:hypothetical protein
MRRVLVGVAAGVLALAGLALTPTTAKADSWRWSYPRSYSGWRGGSYYGYPGYWRGGGGYYRPYRGSYYAPYRGSFYGPYRGAYYAPYSYGYPRYSLGFQGPRFGVFYSW